MEYSCGAVLYRMEQGRPVYVLVGQPHHGFPKGHMEAGETEPETALREIKEETGVDAVLDTSFREVIEYELRSNPRVKKQVTFFLATYGAAETPAAHSEIHSVRCVGYREAYELLWHRDLRRVLQKAELRLVGRLPEGEQLL